MKKENTNIPEETLGPEHFPEAFVHSHEPIVNPNQLYEERLSMGQRASDWVAKIVGSWPFIIIQSLLLVLWIILNVIGWFMHWDPYPFILMNLFLSLQAAYTAPIIMMSQNRQALRDRIEAHTDYLVNQKAEKEIRAVLDHLDAQNRALMVIHKELRHLKEEMKKVRGDMP